MSQEHNSVAPLPLRFLSVCIDWALASVASYAWLNYDPLATLVLFAVSTWIFQVLFTATVGQFLAGLRLKMMGAEPSTIGSRVLACLIRTVLLLTVLTSLVYDEDQRALHDRASGTVIVRA